MGYIIYYRNGIYPIEEGCRLECSANLAETACTVHTINILSFDILSGMGGRAMDDNCVNLFHFLYFLL